MINNGDYIVIINNPHNIMKAKELLDSNNLNVLVLPAPRTLKVDCSLAIKIYSDEYILSRQLLEQHNIPVMVYAQFIDKQYNILT